MQRKRRGAFDSDSVEEYIQLATLGQFQTNIYYDEKKLKEVHQINKYNNTFDGFDHGDSLPNIDYLNSADLLSELSLKSSTSLSEDIFNYYIMIIGNQLTPRFLASVMNFCKTNEVDTIEISKNQSLEIAIKIIPSAIGKHVFKFYIYDTAVETHYQPIINVYFAQTQNYLIVAQNKLQSQAIQELVKSKVSNANVIEYINDDKARDGLETYLNQIIEQLSN